jgi:hypothetical protein
MKQQQKNDEEEEKNKEKKNHWRFIGECFGCGGGPHCRRFFAVAPFGR